MRGFLLLASVVISLAAVAEVAEFDRRIATDGCQADTNGLVWVDGVSLPLESRGFSDTKSFYSRLPADVVSSLPQEMRGVRYMQRQSTGHYFIFKTDSDVLSVEWVLEEKKGRDPFIPPQGMYGVDIYRGTGTGWRFVKNGRLSASDDPVNRTSVSLPPGLKPVLVYLPTRGVVTSVRIGLRKGARLERYLHPSGIVKPVVHYGTSLVHGGCASRPGLCFANRAGRLADVPYVNLGFSGGARLEAIMARAMARIEASLYIIDPVWNSSERVVHERFERFVRILHEAHPDTPILVCEGAESDGRRNPGNDAIKGEVARLRAEDPSLSGCLHYLPSDGMLPQDGESTHDYCHPNDYGSIQMSEVFARKIRSILGIGDLPCVR